MTKSLTDMDKVIHSTCSANSRYIPTEKQPWITYKILDICDK